MIKAQIVIKNIFLFCRLHVFFGWFAHTLKTTSNFLQLSKWISVQNKHELLINDFFTFKRVYDKRLDLYRCISKGYNLDIEDIEYLEFGVCEGNSLKWWIEHNKHEQTSFSGFDTFEGLPEEWGHYKKGDMSAHIPLINDQRAKFYKGLFQETLPLFLTESNLRSKRLVIHLDADLYSSTLYVLATLGPYLKSGDIIFFDEFNVPNHEFLAHKNFMESFYINLKPIGAVNNFFQVAFIVE